MCYNIYFEELFNALKLKQNFVRLLLLIKWINLNTKAL